MWNISYAGMIAHYQTESDIMDLFQSIYPEKDWVTNVYEAIDELEGYGYTIERAY